MLVKPLKLFIHDTVLEEQISTIINSSNAFLEKVELLILVWKEFDCAPPIDELKF